MIALDKQAHFWAGMALTAAALPFDIVVAVMGTVVVAALKEVVYDRFFGGTVDIADFAWTIAGAAVFLAWMCFASFLVGAA